MAKECEPGRVLEQREDIVKYLSPHLCIKVARRTTESNSASVPCTTQDGETVFVEDLYTVHMRYPPKKTILAMNSLLGKAEP
jgi:hypothetical protein